MAERPSPKRDGEIPVKTQDSEEVARLRAMSREERIRLLTSGLDDLCGPLPARRKLPEAPGGDKPRRKE